jgi:hypothetical protein
MGFWSTLARIGSSLIPGVGPLVGSAIGAGVGALTGGGGSAPQPYFMSKDDTKSLVDTTANQFNSQLGRSGPNPAVGQAEQYYSGLLNGDREKLGEILAPETSTILSQYDNAARAAAEFAPRGGGRTVAMAENPTNKATAYGKVLAGARAGAADKLGQLGTAERGQDISLTGLLGSKEASLDNTILGGGQRASLDQIERNSKMYNDLGSSIGSILTQILKGKKKGGGGAGIDLSQGFSFLG